MPVEDSELPVSLVSPLSCCSELLETSGFVSPPVASPPKNYGQTKTSLILKEASGLAAELDSFPDIALELLAPAVSPPK